jgi:hypothetical protein
MNLCFTIAIAIVIVITILHLEGPMGSKEFRVGGRSISLSQQHVEDRLDDLTPEPVRRHYVVVKGRRFPVKQALAAATILPLSRFISTEAVRVFRNLRFEVGRVGENSKPSKNLSETLFEQYLGANGLGHFQFEPTIPGISTRPDYVLRFNGQDILLEVKEFEATQDDFKLGGGSYDPYGPIREKIQAARKKFKGLKRYCCCLVLFNAQKPLVDLSWMFVYGAMLGNLSIRIPFDPSAGRLVPDEATQGFYGGGGKMLRYAGGKAKEPQNTRLTAIIVLDQLALGRRRFLAEMQEREGHLGRKLILEESLAMLEAARGSEKDWGLRQLRVIVCENPHARIQLTRGHFRGPFDERYGRVQDRVGRVFAGDEIVKLEADEQKGSMASAEQSHG